MVNFIKKDKQKTEISAWKKALSICGVLTQTIGFLIDSKILIIVGLISIIVGLIFIFMLR